MEKFKIAKFQFEAVAQEKILLPAYKGSTFRGGFGHVLKRITCVNKRQECESCLLKEKCLYMYLFETSPPQNTKIMRKYRSVPRPFVIEPPLSSDREYHKEQDLSFGLILIGKAIEYLPYFVFTFQELGKIGLGKDRGKYVLEKVVSLGLTKKSIIYQEKDNLLHDSYHLVTPDDFQGISSRLPQNRLTLKFITPTRIKYQDRLTQQPEFHVLVRNLLRRISLLSYFHCHQEFKKEEIRGLIDKAKQIKIKDQNLRWYDWERYSSRQNTRMKLGGFLGEITYEGRNLKDFLPYVFLGSYIHVGKGASFGLGRYEITTHLHLNSQFQS